MEDLTLHASFAFGMLLLLWPRAHNCHCLRLAFSVTCWDLAFFEDSRQDKAEKGDSILGFPGLTILG